MATKKPFDKVRNRLMADTKTLFEGLGYEVLTTGSQEICLPIVGDEGAEGYLVVTFKIPSGSRDGDEYDGYAMAQEYSMKLEEKAAKKVEADKKKADKIARDKAKREQAKAEKANKA